MTTVRMIEEADATGEVKDLYEEIKKTLGIAFVPNMYKVMAPNPSFLRANWAKINVVMQPRKLDKLTKEIIALSVSAVMGCQY